jgi:RNA polymerase sigma-70 factor (ECF subfamily)
MTRNCAQIEKQNQFKKEILALVPYIKSVAKQTLSDYRNVEEVAQDVLLKAWKNFDHMPHEGRSLTAWIYKTAQRTAFDCGRAVARDELYVDSADYNLSGLSQRKEDTCYPMFVCEPACTDSILDPFVARSVIEFLHKLSTTQRQVLVLHCCGYSYEEIAEATSTSIGTVRSRLHHARSKAKRSLARHL